MKIASSDISMQSEHSSLSIYKRTESLDSWRAGKRTVANAEMVSVRAERSSHSLDAQTAVVLPDASSSLSTLKKFAESVTISTQARSLQKTEIAAPEDQLDPRIALLKTMIESLTGRPINLISMTDVGAGGDASAVAPIASTSAAAPAVVPAGFGMNYQRHETYAEYEETSVSASGTIKTTDGRSIDFSLELTMSRSFISESHTSIQAGTARKDPLVLNFGGTAAELSDQSFRFDLDGDGKQEKIAQFASASGYLALDRNGNGRIDDGRELFGPRSNSGYGELAALDTDKNGWIDESDAAFKDLKIWVPNQNGGTLLSLKEAGVGALALAHVSSAFELRGNGNKDLGAVRDTGAFLFEDGRVGNMQEIDLTV